jgi:hypothetical protein
MTDRERAFLDGCREGYYRALSQYAPVGRSKEQEARDEKHWRECARREFPDPAKQEAA